MFVLVAVILGLIIGKARGGRLSAIKLKNINLWFLGLIGAILQIGLHVSYHFGAAPSYATVISFISYILVLLMFIFNFNDVWTILMTIGIAANFIAAFINGGKMPVASGIVKALPDANMVKLIGNGGHAVYTALTSDSTFWVLGIVLPVPIPQLGRITALYGGVPGLSIGTILALIGALGFVQYAMNAGVSEDEAAFLDDSKVGTEDYIVAPDEMENFVPKEESRYKTGPLDWLNDTSEDIFTMTDDKAAPVKKPKKREAVSQSNASDHQNSDKDETVPEKTMALPDLSPELLDQIRNHSKTRQMDFNDRKEPEENLEDTRVFTTLKDLGHYDTKPIPTVADKQEEAALTEEEAFAEDGFFTQSYYKQEEPAKADDATDEPATDDMPAEPSEAPLDPDTSIGDIQENQAAQDTQQPPADDAYPADDATRYDNDDDDHIAESDIKEVSPMPDQKARTPKQSKQNKQTIVPERTSPSPWASVKKPKAEKRKNREAAQKINPYRKYSAEQAAGQVDVSRDDEKKMLNVWHQVSEETKALRSRSKRTPNWNPEADPFEESEKSRQQLKRSHTRAARLNHYPEEAAGGRDAVNRKQRQASTRAAQGQAASLTTDEEREKAGFKKVEMNVDGKNFSYWRKKKAEDE